jgi:hypothetical protein
VTGECSPSAKQSVVLPHGSCKQKKNQTSLQTNNKMKNYQLELFYSHPQIRILTGENLPQKNGLVKHKKILPPCAPRLLFEQFC